MARHILVTGGLGYIGSHTVILLVQGGFRVTVLDNLSNSNEECLRRIHLLTGQPDKVEFVKADLRDAAAVRAVFARSRFECVIHFAAFKAVGESRAKPLLYYSNNMTGTLCLLEAMAEAGCKRLVFSSSCTVYGAGPAPFSESAPLSACPTNAYAATKRMTEDVLLDVARADAEWSIVILRYFNPVGAHPSGLLGEDPRGIPNCLMPFASQVLVGRLPQLTVHGGDYETRDGTAVRDYIHVMDVARGHIDALQWQERGEAAGVEAGALEGAAATAAGGTGASAAAAAALGHRGVEIFNFGTGRGTSVLELVAAMELASGKRVPLTIGPRRPGDVPEAYADPSKAARVLGWRAVHSLADMCAHAWKWQSANPMGYDSPEPRALIDALEAERGGAGGAAAAAKE